MKLLEYLSFVKKRPGMYMSDEGRLRDLELQLWGYSAALKQHQIENDVTDFNSSFREFVYSKKMWGTSRGWAGAIERNSASPEEAINLFFELVNLYFYEEHKLENAVDESKVR